MGRASVGRLSLAAGALLAVAATVAVAAPLEVESTPAGGTVFLDDRYLGVTPLAVDVPAEGAHLLHIRKRGFTPWRTTVDLGTEPTQVRAELSAEPLGQISVTTEPASADVYVDGRLIGKSPLAATEFELGFHRLQIARSGFRLETQDVNLSAQEPLVELSLTLTARVADYLVAHVEAHPEDIMAITDLAHEYAIRHQFDECLEVLGKGFDAVADYSESQAPEEVRRLYQEVQRLHDKQFDYAPDDVVAELRPRLLEALRAGIERRPANGYTYLSLGGQLLTEGDTAATLDAFEVGAQKADSLVLRIRLAGRADSLRYQRGTAAEKQKDWNAAIAAYEELVKLHPSSWATENALSRMVTVYAVRLSKPAEALQAARRLVAQFPNSPTCPSVLADTANHLSRAGEYEQAASLHEEVAATYPWFGGAAEALGSAASIYEDKLKDPGRALTAWQKLMEIGGRSEAAAEARAHAAAILRTEGHVAEADALTDELMDQFAFSQAAFSIEVRTRGRARDDPRWQAYREVTRLCKERKADEALAQSEALIQQAGEHYYSCRALQMVIQVWRAQKDYEKAIAAHRRFAALWPDHPDAADHLYQAAYALEATVKDLPRAIEAYQQCIDAYPESYAAERSLYRLGQTWMSEAQVIDYQRAMDAFLRLARDYPHSEYARLSRKYAADCQMQLRDPERARAMFMELMTEDPDDYAAYLAAASGYELIRMRPDEQ